MSSGGPSTDIPSFRRCLSLSRRVLVLVGAGLSASSGIPTFRGTDGLWRHHDVAKLATPDGFAENPRLVWEFYAERLQEARSARPNRAHYALAELARRRPDFLTISQNIDGNNKGVFSCKSGS